MSGVNNSVNNRYAAVILAGGLSERMHRLKPMLPLGDGTIIDHVIATFSSTNVDIFLVVGYRHDEIEAGIQARDNTIVYNPDYEQGMLSSVQAGVGRLPPDCRAFFVLPGDVPLVRPATIRRLMSVAEERPENIVYPVFRGKRGHPPLIPSALVPAVLGWRDDGGLKAVLGSRKELALDVPVPDSNILFDIDTPEDYDVLLERFHRREIPTDEECEVIFNEICHLDHDRTKHCIKVSEVAVAIAKALEASGHEIDMEVVRVAARLHDIAKGVRKHDIAGGDILRELGFGKVADVVAVHSDLAGGNTGLSLEAKTVYLADKLVMGESMVSLDERYSSANRRFAVTPEIEAAINERLKVAHLIKNELESRIGRPLDSVYRSAFNHV